jgi:hypothetical protein
MVHVELEICEDVFADFFSGVLEYWSARWIWKNAWLLIS